MAAADDARSDLWRLWTMLANGQGAMLNAARLAQGLGVSAPMINRYIDIRSDLLLARRLTHWSGNLNKRLVQAPKIYIRDNGLVYALLEFGSLDQLLGHPVLGSSLENFVIEALITAAGGTAVPMYSRTADGAELDLVLERGGKPFIGIEIKRNSAPKLSPGFKIAYDDLAIPHRIVVCSAQERYRIRTDVEVHSRASAAGTVRDLLRSPF